MIPGSGFLHRRLEEAVRALLEPDPRQRTDFSAPQGEPALASPDSVSWQVFKNPLALFIGGIGAVLLELAEPRVRTGVWEHTNFRTDPLTRLRRTALAAMLTVYGPRSKDEAMIAAVGRAHARVTGTTPAGVPYRADDPELLDWVQATAAYGFLEAYCHFVRPLGKADKDRYYAESRPAAALYGAAGAPPSVTALEALFAAMRPRLERSDIVFEFLAIMQRAPILPAALAPVQRMLVRAGVSIVPRWARDLLGFDSTWELAPWEARLSRMSGTLADRVALPGSPAVTACRRLGLPANYLYVPAPRRLP